MTPTKIHVPLLISEASSAETSTTGSAAFGRTDAGGTKGTIPSIPCSVSTGIVESVIALDTLATGLVPGSLNCEQPDPACGPQLQRENARRGVRVAMNNSFGFGGNNCSLVFGAERGS